MCNHQHHTLGMTLDLSRDQTVIIISILKGSHQDLDRRTVGQNLGYSASDIDNIITNMILYVSNT